ncbi:MAG: peptidyl-prolyl cis-trans isomerase [Deinococcales bacterium]
MKFSKRTNTIILWIVALGLLVSMVIAFTPGQLFGAGNQANNANKAALLVDGQPISELEVARARQEALYRSVTSGEVGDDLQTMMLDDLINRGLLRREAQGVRVSNNEVRDAVNEFRRNNGVDGSRNDQAYINILSRNGFTDASFRDYMHQQLKEEKYRDSLTENVSVSDAELQTFFESNQDRYRSDEKIIARQIVVDTKNLADELRARALAGEDFAELAKSYSREGADIGGALGASGDDAPAPIARLALPNNVASAAFSQGSGGITEPIEQAGRFYLVKVEEFLASTPQSFDEVKDRVAEEALNIKKSGVLEARLLELRQKANITIPEDSVITFDNPAVAKVGDAEITRADLARNLYTNPQVQNFLTPQNASFITQFFKPSVLNNLVDQELAYQGAKDLEVDFFGTKGNIAQSALSYVSKDTSASDEDLQGYYDENLASYTIDPSAVVSRVNFKNEAEAEAFRTALLDGSLTLENFSEGLNERGGELQELGTVEQGVIGDELDAILFDFEVADNFSPLSEGKELSRVVSITTVTEVPVETPSSEVVTETTDAATDVTATDAGTDATVDAATITDTTTDASTDASTTDASTDTATDAVIADAATTSDNTVENVEAAGQTEPQMQSVTETNYVVLLANRIPGRVQAFDEVRPQVEQAVLNEKRQALRTDWLDGLREKITVENSLAPETEAVAPAPSAEDAFTTTPLEGPSVPEVVPVEGLNQETNQEGIDFENTAPTGSEPVEGTVETNAVASTSTTTNSETTTTTSSETTPSESVETTSESSEATPEPAPQPTIEPTTEPAAEPASEPVGDTGENSSVSTMLTETSSTETNSAPATNSESTTSTTTVTTTTSSTTSATNSTEEASSTSDTSSNSITITSEADVEKLSRDLADRLRTQRDAGEDLSATQAELKALLGSLSSIRGFKGSYTVQEGDTLNSIADANYGDATLWPQILEANGFLIDDADQIFPGFELLLPTLGTSSSSN